MSRTCVRCLCRELARVALEYVMTQDEAAADLDEEQLGWEMAEFAIAWFRERGVPVTERAE